MLNLLNPFWKYICAALSAASLSLVLTTYIQSTQIHRWHVQNDKNVAGRLADQARYAQAQKDAAVQNKAQVAAIEQQQQKVTNDVETRYQADLARLERMHATSAAPSSVAVKPGSPAPSAAPSGPGCEALPLPADELLRARETELQLNALIDWTLQQSAVDPNELREPPK
jgi:hypothetical protein